MAQHGRKILISAWCCQSSPVRVGTWWPRWFVLCLTSQVSPLGSCLYYICQHTHTICFVVTILKGLVYLAPRWVSVTIDPCTSAIDGEPLVRDPQTVIHSHVLLKQINMCRRQSREREKQQGRVLMEGETKTQEDNFLHPYRYLRLTPPPPRRAHVFRRVAGSHWQCKMKDREKNSVFSSANTIFITLYQAVSSFSLIRSVPYYGCWAASLLIEISSGLVKQSAWWHCSAFVNQLACVLSVQNAALIFIPCLLTFN